MQTYDSKSEITIPGNFFIANSALVNRRFCIDNILKISM